MPNLRRMIAGGFHATVDACMPTVTNVNNASICTGTWPAVHGITANSYLDLVTREEHYMDRAELLLAPTLFERAARAGRRSALLTAKVKTIRMLARGADLTLAAEAPDPSWVARLGPPPGIYSAEINHWLLDAAALVLRTRPGRRRRLLPHDRLPDAHGPAGRGAVPAPPRGAGPAARPHPGRLPGPRRLPDGRPRDERQASLLRPRARPRRGGPADPLRHVGGAGPVRAPPPHVRRHRLRVAGGARRSRRGGRRRSAASRASKTCSPATRRRRTSGSTRTASATSSCSATATRSSGRSTRPVEDLPAGLPHPRIAATSSACRSSCTASRSPAGPAAHTHNVHLMRSLTLDG